MSDDVVIRFENVSKRYKRTFGGLRHLVQDGFDKLLGRNDGGPPEERYLWALKDVSFEVRRGEILGIIGLNGAGKSTILKLASRITHPTGGNIEIKGQVGALIEVGAGFHPELSGRENVYLNGSILGMSREEIEEKYDSIVDFAELDGFMDMPVKRYSSGMYVRLGFAVAAHLEPDIFLIDEVLAVGDAGFQAKCLNKIQELRERAVTIILVSHNITNIARYSDRVLWVEKGLVKEIGEPDSVTHCYLNLVNETITTPSFNDFSHYGCLLSSPQSSSNDLISIESVVMKKVDGTVCNVFDTGETASLEITYFAKEPIFDPIFGITIINILENKSISSLTTKFDEFHIESVNGYGKIIFHLEPLIFLRGSFSLDIFVRHGLSFKYLSVLLRAASFSVNGPSLSNNLVYGDINLPHSWSHHSS